MIAVMAVAALTANAQKGEYYVTPRANIGYGVMTNSEAIGGLLGGIGCNFEYMIADKFGISAAVDFSYLQGDKEKFTYGSYSKEQYYTMGFVNIPVLANYHMGNFSIGAGVQPSFMVSPKYHVEYTSGSAHEDVTADNGDNFNKFQFGIPVNLSYTFSSPVTIGLNVTIPVTNLLKNDIVKAAEAEAGKSLGNTKLVPILLTVGYRF